MYLMSKAQDVVMELAKVAAQSKLTIPVLSLADILNASGIETTEGSVYEGKRGTYHLVSSTWRVLKDVGEDLLANAVADTFVTPEGAYAYLK